MTDHTLARADEVLTELIELVETARTLPMSSSCVVPRERTLDLLDALRDVLPPELAEARRVVGPARPDAERGRQHRRRAAAAGARGGPGHRHRAREQARALADGAEQQAEAGLSAAAAQARELVEAGQREQAAAGVGGQPSTRRRSPRRPGCATRPSSRPARCWPRPASRPTR